MATFLYRLGRGAFHRRWLVALLWLVVLAGTVVGAVRAPSAPDPVTTMPGIESQRAFDLLDERFPDTASDGATARIVFVAGDGAKVTDADTRAVIDRTVAEVSAGSQVAAALDPFESGAVSGDGTTAYATVSYTVPSDDVSDPSKDALRAAVDEARAEGVTVEVGGDVLESEVSAGGAAEGIGILVAAVVLLITFGSMAAAGLPLLTAVIGVGATLLGIAGLASTLGLPSTTTALASMLGLAVGIDYALFIVSRYREECARGYPAREAAGLAVGTAGTAVVFAGLTVVIALAGLFVIGIPILTSMGLAAAVAVMVAVLIALTLVPALLGFWPRAVLSRRVRSRVRGGGRRHDQADGPEQATENAGSRWARFVTGHPLPVLLGSVLGLGALALPVLGLQLGTPGAESKPVSTTERRAYDALAEGFGPGFNGPLTVVVDARGTADPQAAVRRISETIAHTDGVVSASSVRFNEAGDTAVLSAIASTGPTDGRTADLVHAIRDGRPAIEAATGATFEVTGTTALNIDIAQKVQRALVPYLVVVVGLAIVLLMVVFRSVLVPLKAAVGFLLSVLAALGSVVAVFQWGWLADVLGVEQPGPIMSLMPIFLVGIVFGLAMDYEVFLVSRMREAHVHGEQPAASVVSGFRASARVVVAAALIMIAVFAGFITAGESMIKMIGFGLAVAVLFDAFVVRMAFVPAVLALLGRHAWWMPGWLDRLLPRVDVEGEALSHLTRPRPLVEEDRGVEEDRNRERAGWGRREANAPVRAEPAGR